MQKTHHNCLWYATVQSGHPLYLFPHQYPMRTNSPSTKMLQQSQRLVSAIFLKIKSLIFAYFPSFAIAEPNRSFGFDRIFSLACTVLYRVTVFFATPIFRITCIQKIPQAGDFNIQCRVISPTFLQLRLPSCHRVFQYLHPVQRTQSLPIYHRLRQRHLLQT